MSLKFGEAEYNVLPIQEGEPVQIEMPHKIPQIKLHVPIYATPEEAKGHFLNIPAWSAHYDSCSNMWVGTLNNGIETQTSSDVFLTGDRFEETAEGVYGVRGGLRKQILTNTTLRIVSVTEHWLTENMCEEVYRCAVSCFEAWGDSERFIDIPREKFKAAYRLIHAKYPETSLSTQDVDAVDSYLTKIAQRDLPHSPRKIESTCMGWLETRKMVRYYLV